MTYQQLLEQLSMLSPKQLKQTVTLHDDFDGEYYPVAGTDVTDEDDVLDAGHFILIAEGTIITKLGRLRPI